MKHPYFALLPLSAAVLLAAGCNVVPAPEADMTRHYVLTSPVPEPGPAAGSLRLGFRSVELASYLGTRDIVLRNGTNELVLQDYARWAEPLEAGIGRILRMQLASAPAVGRVYPQPFPLDGERDYDVSVSVLHCEGGTPAGMISHPTARFSAVFEISTVGTSPKVVARRAFTAPEAAWDGRDYARLAELLSEDVARLGRDIVAALPPAAEPKP